MHANFAESPPRTHRRCLVVASLVYERSSCSEARATTRRALQQPLRGDGGYRDPLRAREGLLRRSRFAPNRDQQNKNKSSPRTSRLASRTSNPAQEYQIQHQEGESREKTRGIEIYRAAREGARRGLRRRRLLAPLVAASEQLAGRRQHVASGLYAAWPPSTLPSPDRVPCRLLAARRGSRDSIREIESSSSMRVRGGAAAGRD
nr:unnamed protein product [Digitaria exilis]